MSQDKRIPLRFLAAPLAFAFLCILYFAFDFYLKAKEKQVRATFEQTFPADRKPRLANTSAIAFPALALQVGILLQSERLLPPNPEFTEKSVKFRKVWDELNHYVKAEALVSGPPVAVPEATKQFLEKSESTLDGIIQFLVDEDVPQWREDPSVESNFIPVLIGLIRLHHTVAAEAIHALNTGRMDDSDRALLACWKLNQSLKKRREPIAIIVAMKCSSVEIGLLKKMPAISAEWRDRIHSLDYRKNLGEAMVLESGRAFDALNEESQRREFLKGKVGFLPDWLKGPAFIVFDPYIRLSRVNYLSSEMDFLSELKKGKVSNESRYEHGFFAYYEHDYEAINTTLTEFEEARRNF